MPAGSFLQIFILKETSTILAERESFTGRGADLFSSDRRERLNKQGETGGRFLVKM